MICDEGADIAECVKEIKAYKKEGNEVKRVSRNNVRHCPTRNPKYSVVVIDCGIRNVSLRKMKDCGINLAILPYNSTFEEVMNQKPDGVFIPNGPGDPSDVPETVELVKKLKGKLPVFAIGLGLQIVARAYGAKTFKMKKGHSGSNLPVKDVKTKEIEITSQHHLYTVDASSLKNSGLEVTKINVIDGDVEGVEDAKNGIFAVAYQPENCAEPGYNHAVYQKFLENIKKFAGGKTNAEKNRY